MKKFTKLLLVAAMAITALTGCSKDSEPKDRLAQIKERGYIVLGTSPDFAPNEFYIDDNGKKKIVGTDISLAQHIADYLGVELKIQTSEFQMVLGNVQSGNVDIGISGFAWKPERAEVVDFSIDYSRDSAEITWQGLMCRKEDAEKFKDKETVKKLGIKVGAQNGSIQYEMAKTITDEKNIVSLGETTMLAGLLSTGDIDAFVITNKQGETLMQTYDNIMVLPEETFNMDPDDYYNRNGAIVMKDPSTATLLEEINKAIEIAKKKDENGVSLLDVWYKEAEALRTKEIDLDDIGNYEDSGNYSEGLKSEEK